MIVTCIKDVYDDRCDACFVEGNKYELVISDYDGYIEIQTIDECGYIHVVLQTNESSNRWFYSHFRLNN